LASTQFAREGLPAPSPDDKAVSYWQQLALSYRAVGSPLKPTPEVVAFVENAVKRFAGQRPKARMRAVLLGVTPSIAQIAWPEGTFLTAADYSLDMVRGVWPGNVTGAREAVCANWRSLPLRPRSCDVVIGDGAMNCIRFPGEFRELADQIHAALNERGLALLRCYAKPAHPEEPGDVFADAARGAIPSFHQFKFRLLMAMQESTVEGVAVDAVYKMWKRRTMEDTRLCERAGWSRQEAATIDLYCGSNTVHTFPTLAELQSALAERFEELEISCPSYALSERCPILVLKRRNS